MKKPWYESSRCRKGKYHDFRPALDRPDAVKETCVLCGLSKVWRRRPGGRIDNAGYLRWHVRNFCQPFGSTRPVFAELYGLKALRRAERDLAIREKPDMDKVEDEAIKHIQTERLERITH